MAVSTSIVLVLPSPLEDTLSAKRSISIKRRVQAFVILAIAFFVAAGFAANRLVTAANTAHTGRPAQDAVVPPSPEGTAKKAPTAAASPPSRPRTTAPRSQPPAAAKVVKPKAKHGSHAPTAAVAGAPAKNIAAEALAVQLTNAQRAAHGCSALRVDSRLVTAARQHSRDMHVRHYFEHDTPDGKTPWDRIRADGYSQPGAENIALGYATAQAVVNGWMNSPGHRANILNCSLKAVGIGVEYGSGGPWWTQDFGFK
jgi:uncharacterized protein YkwD